MLTERLALIITGDSTDAVKAVDDIGRSSNRLGQTESRLSRVGSTLTQRVTPAALGAGAAFGVMLPGIAPSPRVFGGVGAPGGWYGAG